MNKILLIITLTSLIFTTSLASSSSLYFEDNLQFGVKMFTDYDPLVDISVTIEINKIRLLENFDLKIPIIGKLNKIVNPDFYVKIFINDEEFTSPIWDNTKYVYDPEWSVISDVPDDEEWVNISIQLWDSNSGFDILCDLSGYTNEDDDDDSDVNLQLVDNRFVNLQYNVKTGHWIGDDRLEQDSHWDIPDTSGYGRLNGCDDGSFYQYDRDCELWFDIYQNDFDGDKIPYWTEINIFNTDPNFDNTGEDFDNDSIPIEWEWKWGYFMRSDHHSNDVEHLWRYSPITWEDHENLDPDKDGLNNVEEYITSKWGSDPFRKDLFVELDQMSSGPNDEPASLLPDNSKELLRTAYDKNNVVYHLDDGTWVDSGSDMIPFDDVTSMAWGDQYNELVQIYDDYFLHGDPNNWRQGVFHYGVVVYQCSVANGNAFGGNRFQISSNGLNEKAESTTWLDRDIVFASAYMHECGHTLGIENPAVDDQVSKYPWQLDWWKWRPYKSVMNYGYMYLMVDYSDGSRGKYDFDDWQDMDMTAFQQIWD